MGDIPERGRQPSARKRYTPSIPESPTNSIYPISTNHSGYSINQEPTPSKYNDSFDEDMPSYRSDKNLRDLGGTWTMNKSLSTGIPQSLEIQGYNSTQRKQIIAAPVKLQIYQSHYPSQVFVKSLFGTPSIAPLTERLYPPQRTGTWSDWALDWETKNRSRWVKGMDFEHKDGIAYLTHGLERLGEFLEMEVECEKGGWSGISVWFMERGRLVRRVVLFGKEGKRSETKWVFESDGPGR